MTNLARERQASIAATIPGFGAPPSWQVCVYRSTVTGGAYAETSAWSTTSLAPPSVGEGVVRDSSNMCFVRLFPKFSQIPAQNLRVALGHEMYHCLHFEQRQRAGNGPSNNMWAEESLATWTANWLTPGTYQPTAHPPGSHYAKWIDEWQTGLFQRSYDALGFFGLLEEQNGYASVWAGIPAAWAAGANDGAVFAALGGRG